MDVEVRALSGAGKSGPELCVSCRLLTSTVCGVGRAGCELVYEGISPSLPCCNTGGLVLNKLIQLIKT